MKRTPLLPSTLYADAADFIQACLDPNPAGRPAAHRLPYMTFLANPPRRSAAAAAAAAAELTECLNGAVRDSGSRKSFLNVSQGQKQSDAVLSRRCATSNVRMHGTASEYPHYFNVNFNPTSQNEQLDSNRIILEGGTYASSCSFGAEISSFRDFQTSDSAAGTEGKSETCMKSQQDEQRMAVPFHFQRDGVTPEFYAANDVLHGLSTLDKESHLADSTSIARSGLRERFLACWYAWLKLEGGFTEDEQMEAEFVSQWDTGRGFAWFGTILLATVSAAIPFLSQVIRTQKHPE